MAGLATKADAEAGGIKSADPVAEEEFEILILGGQMVKVPKKKPGSSSASGGKGGGKGSGKGGGGKGSQAQSTRLLVSGLSSSTTADSLAAHFSTAGKVSSASLVAGGSSGRVEFADAESAERAMSELDRSSLDGSEIGVQLLGGSVVARSKSVGGRFTSLK